MVAKLAVLVAVAVVFAPGWGDEPGNSNRSRDVAALVLAPTFDEAVDRKPTSVHKLVDRHPSRSESGKVIGSVPEIPAPATRGIVLVALVALALLGAAGLHLSRIGRAPPLLSAV